MSIIVLDTETGGLDSSIHPVLSIGAVKVDNGQIIDGFYSLAQCSKEAFDGCHPKALEVNKITWDELSTAPSSIEVASAFGRWTKGYELTSYNVAFDSRFVEVDPWWLGVYDWSECIMERATAIMGPLGLLPPRTSRTDPTGGRWKWARLSEAAQHFGVDQEAEGEAHNALADAKVAALIMLEMDRRDVR